MIIDEGDCVSIRKADENGRMYLIRGKVNAIDGSTFTVTHDGDEEVKEYPFADLRLAGPSRFKKGSLWQTWRTERKLSAF